MEPAFTPVASLGGGLLIGLGAVMLMAGLGRIFGATGILSGLALGGSRDEVAWRAALALGVVLGAGSGADGARLTRWRGDRNQ